MLIAISSVVLFIAVILVVNTILLKQPPLARDTERRYSLLPALGLIALWPVRFFRSDFKTLTLPLLLLLSFGMGVMKAADYIDAQLFKKAFGVAFNLPVAVQTSWLAYWGSLAAGGAIGGLVVWFIGAWWYRKRLQWCGVADPDPQRLRTVYVLTELWVILVVILYTLANTVRYANPDVAWQGDGGAPTAVINLAYLLSLCVSYFAVSSAYPVKRGRAVFWFLLFPLFPSYFDVASIIARLPN